MLSFKCFQCLERWSCLKFVAIFQQNDLVTQDELDQAESEK